MLHQPAKLRITFDHLKGIKPAIVCANKACGYRRAVDAPAEAAVPAAGAPLESPGASA